MSKVELKEVRPKDLSAEELQRLLAARELNLGKPADFPRMLQNVWNGTWTLYRLDGGIHGVAVCNPEGDRLNIFYLHGDGLFGKMTALTNRLMDIARKQGLSGLSCVTHDPRRARLFRMTPGARCWEENGKYYLELDHGRK